MTDHADIIEAARLRVRPIVLSRFNKFSCVASARVLIDCLTYFGIKAEPYPVTAFIINGVGREMIEAGDSLEEVYQIAMEHTVEDPEGPWTVGLGHDDGDPEGAGHVVVYLPEKDAFMDISLDQINRPHKGIDFPPMVMSGRPDETLSFVDDNGAAIIYYPDPPGRFQKSPNWRGISRGDREAFKDVTGRAIRAIKNEL
jgi:hypothetical protein